MATVIRLKRGGRTHAPYYRVVVVDSRARQSGRVIDEIGIYHPKARPEPRAEVDREKALDWLGKGAQVTDTVRSVLSKQGVLAEFHQRKLAAKAQRAKAPEAQA
jgi:small subunit ribosomal protein S16